MCGLNLNVLVSCILYLADSNSPSCRGPSVQIRGVFALSFSLIASEWIVIAKNESKSIKAARKLRRQSGTHARVDMEMEVTPANFK